MIRHICLTVSFLTIIAAVGSAQVHIADLGQSGVGGAVVGETSQDVISYGFRVNGVYKGIAGLELSLNRESLQSAQRYSVKGVSATVVPLRSQKPGVRWNFGARFMYQAATVNFPEHHYNYTYGIEYGTEERSVEVWSGGGLLFADVDLAPEAVAQVHLSVQYRKELHSYRNEVTYTIGLCLIAETDGGRQFYFFPSYTGPRQGTFNTIGIEMGFFWGK